MPECHYCGTLVGQGDALCRECGQKTMPEMVTRRRCSMMRFHRGHGWSVGDEVLWCSGRGFSSIQEVESYLAPPWLIDQVEDFLAS